MNADFFDACDRHWTDAELLLTEQRWANADHLYGMAAECGLKHLMISFGMSVRLDGSPTNWDDRKHANEIWQRYETYCYGANAAAYPLPNENPFADWKVDQRYANQSAFVEARVQKHKIGASVVRALKEKQKNADQHP